MPPRKTAVFVLGMHRSGTSVVTAAVASLGINAGNRLLEATPDNPKGYFEDAEVVSTNMQLLEHYQLRWDGILLNHNLDVDSLPAHLSAAMESILQRLSSEADSFVLKDPRFALLLPLWLKKCQKLCFQIKYVFAFRAPAATVQSLINRDAMNLQHALCFWISNTFQNIEYVLGQQAIIIEYERLLSTPDIEIERLKAFLQLPNTENSKEIQRFKQQILDPTLNRSTSHIFDETRICEQLSIALYKELQNAASKQSIDTNAVTLLKTQYLSLAGLIEEMHVIESRSRQLLELIERLDAALNPDAIRSLANELRLNDASWSIRAMNRAEEVLRNLLNVSAKSFARKGAASGWKRFFK